MKSTLKIDFSSRTNGGLPTIKIIQPISLLEESYNPVIDTDVKDIMIRDFLHTPYMNDRNYWFKLGSNWNTPVESSTHKVSFIEPVNEDSILEAFQSDLLSRYVSHEDHTECYALLEFLKTAEPNELYKSPHGFDKFKKIIEFFEYLEGQQRPEIRSIDKYF